jgi:hypothetical protein
MPTTAGKVGMSARKVVPSMLLLIPAAGTGSSHRAFPAVGGVISRTISLSGQRILSTMSWLGYRYGF